MGSASMAGVPWWWWRCCRPGAPGTMPILGGIIFLESERETAHFHFFVA